MIVRGKQPWWKFIVSPAAVFLACSAAFPPAFSASSTAPLLLCSRSRLDLRIGSTWLAWLSTLDIYLILPLLAVLVEVLPIKIEMGEGILHWIAAAAGRGPSHAGNGAIQSGVNAPFPP